MNSKEKRLAGGVKVLEMTRCVAFKVDGRPFRALPRSDRSSSPTDPYRSSYSTESSQVL